MYKNGSEVALMGKFADHTLHTVTVKAKNSASAVSKFRKSKFFTVKTAAGKTKTVPLSVHVVSVTKNPTTTVTVIPSKVPASHFHNFFGRSK
jgi:hypothetical protein